MNKKAATGGATVTAAPLLQLLSCNILAGGSMRGYGGYLTTSVRQMLPGRAKRDNLDGLAQVLSGFDLVGLQETDAGSLRSSFLNQTQYLAEAADFPYWSHQPNRRLSHLAQSANGLLSRHKPSEVIDYPLPGRIPGRGALWVRYGRGANALIVVIAHLSLGAVARARQLGFIAELLGERANVVLMGDLNCDTASAELRDLFARTALEPALDPPATFPSWRPRRAIDHILVSPSIKLERLWTVPHAVSDHLPLAASVRLPPGCVLGTPAPG